MKKLIPIVLICLLFVSGCRQSSSDIQSDNYTPLQLMEMACDKSLDKEKRAEYAALACEKYDIKAKRLSTTELATMDNRITEYHNRISALEDTIDDSENSNNTTKVWNDISELMEEINSLSALILYNDIINE